MTDDDIYQQWLARRHSDTVDAGLTDRVMEAIAQSAWVRVTSRRLRLLTWIERSRMRCAAACGGALLVGSLPFVYLAYICQALVF